jgi:hypothetical protein
MMIRTSWRSSFPAGPGSVLLSACHANTKVATTTGVASTAAVMESPTEVMSSYLPGPVSALAGYLSASAYGETLDCWRHEYQHPAWRAQCDAGMPVVGRTGPTRWPTADKPFGHNGLMRPYGLAGESSTMNPGSAVGRR